MTHAIAPRTLGAPPGLSADRAHATDYGHTIVTGNLTKEIIT